MPELAEVEYFRKRWNPGLGRRVAGVRLHARAGVFKTCDSALLARRLPGARLDSSEAAAKQMLFRFTAADGAALWLGVHLGMTGELLVRPAGLPDRKSDHLILDLVPEGRERAEAAGAKPTPSTPAPRGRRSGRHPAVGAGREASVAGVAALANPAAVATAPAAGDARGLSLVFSDFRMFGRVQFHEGADAPAWWAEIAPAVTSPEFSVAAVSAFLRRRARTAIKAVLLMQERFPGIGNWMADEILWRAGIHPARPAGELAPAEVKKLHAETVWVAREALATIGVTFEDPPATWLFPHRWEKGGKCPRTGKPLAHATIGGRTTCWSPARQKK